LRRNNNNSLIDGWDNKNEKKRFRAEAIKRRIGEKDYLYLTKRRE